MQLSKCLPLWHYVHLLKTAQYASLLTSYELQAILEITFNFM